MDDIQKAYTEHATDIYRYLLSLSHNEDLAEDLTQETFFRAMRTLNKYDGSCRLSVWLCQIAKHLWYQWLDKNARGRQVELTDQIPRRPHTGTLRPAAHGEDRSLPGDPPSAGADAGTGPYAPDRGIFLFRDWGDHGPE